MHPNLLLKIYHKQLTRFMKKSHDLHAKDLKLVSYVANKYPGDPTNIVSKLDKIQEGSLYFLRYKNDYNPNFFNNRFSTFIVWPIRSGILNIMKTADTLRIPPYEKKRLKEEYRKHFGHVNTRLIISTHKHIHPEGKGKVSVDDNPDDEYLKSNDKSPEEITMTNTINDLINKKLLTKLSKQERQAIKLRFNIIKYTSKKNHNKELLPYEKIGAIMKMSHQHARTLCHKALKNMKRYSVELKIEKNAYL